MPDAKRKQKPPVTIIGAGRLGTALALALADKSYSIQSLVARTVESARKAARLLNPLLDEDPQVLAAKNLGSLRPAGLFLITTPDDQIAHVAAELARLETKGRKPAALHTSGALSAEVLAPLRGSGVVETQ